MTILPMALDFATLAIALAQSTGLGLVGFARDRKCVVYAHPHRLRRTTP